MARGTELSVSGELRDSVGREGGLTVPGDSRQWIGGPNEAEAHLRLRPTSW